MSPPLTPPIDKDLYKSNNISKIKKNERKLSDTNKSKSYINSDSKSFVSQSSRKTNKTNKTQLSSKKRSQTTPNLQCIRPKDLQSLKLPGNLSLKGPNGENIPVIIPDGAGGFISVKTKKASKKKDKSDSVSVNGKKLGSPLLTEKKNNVNNNNINQNNNNNSNNHNINNNQNNYNNINNSNSNDTSSSSSSSANLKNNKIKSPLIKEIDRNFISQSPSPRLREKDGTKPRKAGKRQSILIPLNPSMTSLTNNGSNNGKNAGLPMFIIPTGPDGKIDPSMLPTTMSHSELIEKQKEYEESIYSDDGRSFISVSKKKANGKKKSTTHRKNSVCSVNSYAESVLSSTNLNNIKSKSETGEFTKMQKRSNAMGRKGLNHDTSSLFSLDVIMENTKRYERSESVPNMAVSGKYNHKISNSALNTNKAVTPSSPSLTQLDSVSEYSSTNFSLKNFEESKTPSSHVSFTDNESSAAGFSQDNNMNGDDEDEESIMINYTDSKINEEKAFATLNPKQRDTVILLKKKIDDCIEAVKSMKDQDLKYDNFNYITNNIQLLPSQLQTNYKKVTLKLLKKFANSSQHTKSLYLLGNIYTHGFPGITSLELKHFKPKYDKAFNCFFQAYKNGHQEASFNVGVCHELGLGTRVDLRRAYQIYQKTATTNHPGAMCRLGLACLNGNLNLHKNLKEAVRWLRLSSMYATEDYPHAYYHLATIYERGIENVVISDTSYAVKLLKKAADLGHIKSQYKLGLCYEFGNLGLNVDAEKSLFYFGKAAAKGHGESMFELAGWYLTGSDGGAKEEEDNDTNSMKNVVGQNKNSKRNTFILEQSDEFAFQWTRKAAERNLSKAEYALGYFYENGIGVEEDGEEAMKWYYVASTHKDPKAIQRMNEKSSIFWVNKFKGKKELQNIEEELYSKPCNYDLIEDELNLHFASETLYDKILDSETLDNEPSIYTTMTGEPSSHHDLASTPISTSTSSSSLSKKKNSKNNTQAMSDTNSSNDKCVVM